MLNNSFYSAGRTYIDQNVQQTDHGFRLSSRKDVEL
jgi:hypothetical protein